MTKQAHLKRAQHLFDKGRFQETVSNDLKRFEPIEPPQKIHYDQRVLTPYFDKKTGQVVYGTIEPKTNALVLLMFLQSDYQFGDDTDIEWADYHLYGFRDQNDD